MDIQGLQFGFVGGFVLFFLVWVYVFCLFGLVFNYYFILFLHLSNLDQISLLIQHRIIGVVRMIFKPFL